MAGVLKALGVGALASLAVAAAGVWLHAHAPPAPPTPRAATGPAALQTLHAACMREMLANTCKVMADSGTRNAAAAAQAGDLVFVAGVGAFDAKSYAELYAAGDAMCSVVRTACATDWSSGQCRTARKLWAV